MVVVAKIRAKQGCGDELAAVFSDFVDWVKDNEDGTLTYTCNRSHEDSDLFLFFERYVDQAAFQAHSSSSRFAEMAGSLQGKVEGGIEMETFDEVGAKI